MLLLSKVIERGLSAKDADDKSINILDIIAKETSQEWLAIVSELLNKSGLTELNQKLQTL